MENRERNTAAAEALDSQGASTVAGGSNAEQSSNNVDGEQQNGFLGSISRAFSRTMTAGLNANFADVVEMDVVARMSKTRLNAEDVIEIVRNRDSSMVERARKQTQLEHPSCGNSRYATATIEELMEELGLQDLKQGLTEAQFNLNQQVYGRNILETSKKPPLWKVFLGQFLNFVVLLLFAAAIGSLILGNIVEGVFIVIIVTLNAILATYMEKSAADALDKLAEISSPTTTVIRNGEEISIDSREIVPGDVIILKMGDTVPADARFIELTEMRINESILTGESEAMKKELVATNLESPFSSNLCFASTSVTAGHGKAIVVTTGMNTQVGQIAKQLQEASMGNGLTPLQMGLNRLGGLIGFLSIFILITIILIAVFTGYEDPTRPDTNRVLSIVLLAVGFAVSSIPEGLPMVVTICLSLGAREMAKRNANIRKLPAVETLGCCSIICSDKTGTLTEGKMTSITIVTFHNEEGKCKSEELLFYPTHGFNPYGGVFKKEVLTDDVKAKLLKVAKQAKGFEHMENNICAETETSHSSTQVKACMLSAYLNSYATKLEKDPEKNRWYASGNMTESPLIVASAKCGIGGIVNKKDNTHNDYPMLKELEVPFTSSRKMMCTIHKLKENNKFGNVDLTKDGAVYTHVATIKGAPDILVKHVRLALKRVENSCIVDWNSLGDHVTTSQREEILKMNEELSSRALRVLLIGMFPLTDEDMEELKKCEESDDRLNWLLNGNGKEGCKLVSLGFVGNLDPPRYGVKEAVETCSKAGVRVIMITGDQKATASAVAESIGLFNQFDYLADKKTGVLECRNLHVNNDHFREYLPDDVLDSYTSKVSVFCRAQPEDKVVIVESLKRQGHLTAMTGDGVNDAPALKAANIGVAMGISGTDVAKGASDMVLLDDNFCTIVKSIESGRAIYANIQKFVSFLLGTNIGEILYLSIAIIIQTLPPVEALQILFLNFLTDGCPAVALAREPPEDDAMSAKPRPISQPIMTRDWWIYGNLPHTIFEAAMVICSILTALYLSTGVMFMKDLNKQCLTVPITDERGNVHNFTYFCKSYEYRVEPSYVGWVTNLNYFDAKKREIVTALGALKGKPEVLTPETQGLFDEIAESFKGIGNDVPQDLADKIEKDENGWFRPKKEITVKSIKDTPIGAAPHGFHDITVRKSTQARTMSFITAVWVEMLRAYTVRSWEYFYKVFNRNAEMHVACSFSAVMCLVIPVVPGVNDAMHLTPIAWWQVLLAVSFAFVTMALDELIPKTLYKRKMRALRQH